MNNHWPNIKRINSSDDNVAKFVFENGSSVAEAVLYKYPTYEDRTVICCSTQSGCPVGCRFCGAGDKFVRSLTCDEIVAQPKYLLDQTGVDAEKIKKLQRKCPLTMLENSIRIKLGLPVIRGFIGHYILGKRDT